MRKYGIFSLKSSIEVKYTMKKFVLGLILGIAIAATSSVYADEVVSFIGKKVDGEFPVILNGVSLTNKVPVIEGTSYAPVREISEALGLEVKFESETVILTSPRSGEIPVNEPKQDLPSLEAVDSQIDGLKSELATLEWQLPRARESAAANLQVRIHELKEQISNLEKQKEELTKQAPK